MYSLKMIWAQVPLAILTAVTTLVLILVLSVFLGSETRTANQEVIDHAIVARCQFAEIVGILKEIGEQSPNLDLSRYPDVNIHGLDCGLVTEPFHPGRE